MLGGGGAANRHHRQLLARQKQQQRQQQQQQQRPHRDSDSASSDTDDNGRDSLKDDDYNDDEDDVSLTRRAVAVSSSSSSSSAPASTGKGKGKAKASSDRARGGGRTNDEDAGGGDGGGGGAGDVDAILAKLEARHKRQMRLLRQSEASAAAAAAAASDGGGVMRPSDYIAEVVNRVFSGGDLPTVQRLLSSASHAAASHVTTNLGASAAAAAASSAETPTVAGPSSRPKQAGPAASAAAAGSSSSKSKPQSENAGSTSSSASSSAATAKSASSSNRGKKETSNIKHLKGASTKADAPPEYTETDHSRTVDDILLGGRPRIPVEKTLDVCFLVDCTSSMLSVIELVKTKLRIILDQVERKHGLATKRVAFVGYRDFCDGADRIVSKGLTSDLPSVQAFIDGVPAKGGGDTPEDVVGGIYTASMLDWKARYCTLLHFADAPGHGREWNGGADDNHSDDSEIAVPESRTARAVEHLQRLMGKRVYYTFVCVNSERYTAATVSKIRAAYEQEGKGKRFQKMEMHSMGAFDQTVENLVNAISMSIMGQV